MADSTTHPDPDPLRSTAREALGDPPILRWANGVPMVGLSAFHGLAGAVLSQADTIDELRAEVEQLTTALFQWRGSASDLTREVERLNKAMEALTVDASEEHAVAVERLRAENNLQRTTIERAELGSRT